MLYILAALVVAASAKDSYVVLLPTSIRPGMDFDVSVNILKATGDVHVHAQLVDGHTQSIASTTTDLVQGDPKELSLKVPHTIKSGQYKLEVTGSGGLTFHNETTLTFNRKSMSVFVQTDKAMYKPGQTVHFRTFAMYPDMKVYTGPMTIEIIDPKSNKIKQMTGVKDASGVFESKMETSSQPVMGDWKIKVTADASSHEQVFTIAEYVLPKFEVTVELPPYALTSDKDVTATVKAKYTYGKPVKGSVTVTAKLDYFYRPWNYHGDEPIVKHTAQIDGETKIILPLDQIKTIAHNINSRKLVVTAAVTESLTGITLNSTKSSVKFYEKATKLEFLKSNPETFKPGLPYTAYLQVLQQDGRPVLHSSKKLTVKTRVTWKEKAPTTTPKYFYPRQHTYNLPDVQMSVPDTGMIPIKVHIPSNASNIYITVTYDGITASKSLSKSYSPSNSYIQLFLKSQHLSAGNDVHFEIKATQPVSDLVYQILSRGSIVATGKVNGNSRTTFQFATSVTPKMAPNARIVVYYVRADGEIVTDSISFDVDGAFENQVSISMDKTSAQPGDNVNVAVTAEPHSLVNLLAVDQSVLLLKSGNDITQSMVIDELKSYDTIHHNDFPKYGGPIFLARRKRMAIWPGWYPVYYGGSDANQIFKNAGVKVMTDAMVYHKVQEYFPPILEAMLPMPGTVPGMSLDVYPTPSMPAITMPTAVPGMPPGGILNSIQGTNTQHVSSCPFCDGFLEKGIDGIPTPGMGSGFGSGSGSGSGMGLKEVDRVRNVFPETWLWLNKTVSTDGRTVITTTVPDTITSWVASAFAVSTTKGLGVSPTSAKIKVFRPFFVSLNLPYSVTRGEHVVLQAIVFNYLAQDVDVVVSIPQSSDYLNIVVNANGQESTESKDQMETVHVKSGEAKNVFFPIVPSKLGKIDIEVSARTNVAADAVRRQLLVEPEGVAKEYNQPILIDLKQNPTFSKTVPLTLPQNVVPGSQSAVVTAIGDLMGPTVSGLDSLLRMPTGCGEQTMIGFAPDVFVSNYLKATKQLSGDVADKALGFMEKGYQRELTYQHKDASFSAFGDQDKSGSMWLTAFVVKTFHQAKAHIFVDDEVLIRAIDWMIARQKSDGSFPEPGRVIHKNMQGGSGSGPALTAFVLISLLENNDLSGGVQHRIARAVTHAVSYLEAQVPIMKDDYTLAITSYALKLAQSSVFNTVFAKLESDAIVKDGYKYWHQPEVAKTTTNHYWKPPRQSNAVDTEITSYVLLTYAEKDDFIGGLNIMKWITTQRNPHGGFSSTQDTVLALQALSQFAKMAYASNFDIQVHLTAGSFSHSFSINKNNALLLQKVQLPSIPSSVHVTATGHGIALVDVSVSFHVDAEVEEPSFEMTVHLIEETINSLIVQTCARWLHGGTSGMAVEEIGIPSGFEADIESIGKIDTLKRTDTADKKIILYFDEIGNKPTCLTVTLQRTGLIAKTQPASVRVYDYYEPNNQATGFYQSQLLKDSSICSVCTECKQCIRN